MENGIRAKKIIGTLTLLFFATISFFNSWNIAGIVLIILAIILATGKPEQKNNSNDKNKNRTSEKRKNLKQNSKRKIGMYNMDLSDYYKKNYDLDNVNANLLADYHFFLGVCFQGRYDELKENYKSIEKESLLYYSNLSDKNREFVLNQKEDLKKACLIAKKHDKKGIGMDMKVGETVGEYFDRTIQKSKTFMKIFDEINSTNYEDVF